MRTMGALAVVGLVLTASPAWADPNDFQLYRLGNPNPASATYDPSASANFRIFARELGAALNSANLTPPETLGHVAYAVSAQLSVVGLNTTEFTFPTTRPMNGTLLLPSIHIRKGLPFSFELGTRLTWIDKSTMGAGTFEVKWAINEGFAHLPDVGLRAHVTRLFNNPDFDLTTSGLDLGVGKQLAIGGMITLTPYGGWNLVWVRASSNLVDFNPGRTPEEAVSTAQVTAESGVYEGLAAGANFHNRFYAGVRFIGGVVQLALELSYSNLGKIQAPAPGSGTTAVDRGLPPVFAFNAAMGLDF